MFLARFLFGSITSGLIRLAIAAAIVFLCYLFIVKPVLSKTDEAVRASGVEQIGRALGGLGTDIQREVRHAFSQTRVQGGNTGRLVHCVRHAHGDAARIRRCTRRF